jgi:cyclohexanone monooxygenase
MSAEHETDTTHESVDMVVVGAGFSGLYMLHCAPQLGLSVRVFEAGDGVGGTWYWNRYPGARCDVESFDYQYSFSPELLDEWRWSERYPQQNEILAYLEYAADKFSLRSDIWFGTKVASARYDEASGGWTVEPDRGNSVDATYVVMATGCLSAANVPAIDGLGDFDGEWYHTGAWPYETVDFTGQRVAAIGTGSSGIQVIPEVADQAAELTVFQRTPNFSIPAFNRKLSSEEIDAELADFAERRQRARGSFFGLRFSINMKSALDATLDERQEEFEKRWQMGGLAMSGAFADLLVVQEADDAAVDFIHHEIRDEVNDPAIADRLLPTGYPVGGKRICLDTNYFSTFNGEHVTLVDVSATPIERIKGARRNRPALQSNGILVGDTEYEVDAIVFAAGFDAMTGAVLAVDIKGRDGVALRDKWSAGPRTLLGLGSAGFPNMFFVTGPRSPSVFSNMIVSIEQHVDWIADAIAYLRDNGLQRIEPPEGAEQQWIEHVNEVANSARIPKASSWYLGANVAGKPRIFMPYVAGVGPYRQICDDVAAKRYEGFVLAE